MNHRTIRLTIAIMVAWPVGLSADPGEPATPPPAPRPKHINAETETAIEKGLEYLVNTQGREGAWRNRTGYGTYPVSMSALGGLALLMNGSTPTQGKYAANVDRVTDFLISCATDTGLIALRAEDGNRPMYGHGFSMLFLGEVYGMTEDADRQQRIHNILKRAVTLTAQSQSDLGGWIYQPDGGTDEGSVTITQLQGLRACRNGGISVPKSVIDKALDYLKISFRSDGGIAYRARNPGPSRPPITAAAICCWFNAGDYENPMAKKALRYCRSTIGPGDKNIGHYFYAHLYYAQALYLAGDAAAWDEYFPKIRDKLLSKQNEDGSWLGDGVGKPYGTALALIILQLPYNRIPIMQR